MMTETDVEYDIKLNKLIRNHPQYVYLSIVGGCKLWYEIAERDSYEIVLSAKKPKKLYELCIENDLTEL